MTPKPYQLRIFAHARRMPFFALAPVAPGTGKSKLAVDIAADKFIRGEIDCAAVIASPKGVHRQWIERVLPEHMTEAVPWSGAVWKSTRKTDPLVMKASPGRRRMRWLAFNIEAFSKGDKAAKALTEFMKSGRCMLIEDESSRIGNPKANCTKALVGYDYRGKHYPGLAEMAVSRCILTGTPITKGVENLWSQYQFVDPNVLGMSNYSAFRARYCLLAPAFARAPHWQTKIVGYRNMEEFVRKIAGVTFVVPKDVLGLPEKTYEEIPVELTKEQRTIYNALRKELVDDLKEMRIASPVNAGARLTRLHQVLSGRAVEPSDNEDEPPTWRPIPSNRIKTLVEYIQSELGGDPCVIWARFRSDIVEIADALRRAGRTPVTYYGDTDDEARARALRDIRSGRASDFVANPAVGGMGVDGLQEVMERAIYYSHGYNREHRWQSEDRIHRLGMRGTAWYGDMVAAGTVDRTALASYKSTEDLIKSIMQRPELVPILNEK